MVGATGCRRRVWPELVRTFHCWSPSDGRPRAGLTRLRGSGATPTDTALRKRSGAERGPTTNRAGLWGQPSAWIGWRGNETRIERALGGCSGPPNGIAARSAKPRRAMAAGSSDLDRSSCSLSPTGRWPLGESGASSARAPSPSVATRPHLGVATLCYNLQTVLQDLWCKVAVCR